MVEMQVSPAVSCCPQQPQQLDPLGDGISSLELIRVSGSDIDVVNAARVCYGKTVQTMTEQDKKLIKYLMQHKHTSPFEHNQLSFRVKCPLYVSRQWMRHRMNSYNEISYRYVKAKDEFYMPQQWRHQDPHNKQSSLAPFENAELVEQYQKVIALAAQTYENLIENKVCRELARGLLPMCTYTEFIFTCNLHSLMHFLGLRLHVGAQYEIRQYAQAMLELATPHFPVSLEAWKEVYKPDLL
ncbi:MAG TPA: FAD-dependent thymidylate synthase [Candidatus Babeliales bacterium]|nr:FAD-dependent thymidylate synthase [Candidatus Babeliales bacterium]